MGKASRQRRRLAQKEARVRAAGRRALVEAVIDDARARIDAIVDPAVPAAAAADRILNLSGGPPPNLAAAIAATGSLDRAREIAAILLERDDVAGRALSVQVAALDGDDPRVLDLTDGLDPAAPAAPSADLMRSRAVALNRSDRPAQAFALLEELTRANPFDSAAEEELAFSVCAMHARLAAENGRPWPCPCGSGADYQACCKKLEEEALARFNDRDAFDSFRMRVHRFAEGRPEFRAAVAGSLDDWFGPDVSASAADGEQARAAVERAWMVADLDPAGPADGPARTILDVLPSRRRSPIGTAPGRWTGNARRGSAAGA